MPTPLPKNSNSFRGNIAPALILVLTLGLNACERPESVKGLLEKAGREVPATPDTKTEEDPAVDPAPSDPAAPDSGSGTPDEGKGETPPSNGGTAPESPTTPPPNPEPSLRSFTFDNQTGFILNPERGFYRHVSDNLLTGNVDYAASRTAGVTLIYGAVNLSDYIGSDIPANQLTKISEELSEIRAAKLKIILRFVYASAIGEADAPLARVLRHIEQLKPILQANHDVIAYFKAGFIGAWGEWHSSTNDLTTPANSGQILEALIDAVPEDRAILVRTPKAKVSIYGATPISSMNAFTASGSPRIGHHNDCFLASSTDFGTYGQGTMTMEEELDFLEAETRFVPIGGETCAVNAPRSQCASALLEMKRLRYSFLNENYHPDVINTFKSESCFDTLRDLMGYRLRLETASVSESVKPGGILRVKLKLTNDGYAAPVNRRPIYLVLSSGADVKGTALISGVDVRRLGSEEDLEIEKRFRIPKPLPAGSYKLSLWLPDADDDLKNTPEFAIRLANQNVWDSATGWNTITTNLTVSVGATGEVDEAAQTFVEIP